MSEPRDAEAIDAIVRRAQREAEGLWRQEHAHRRRQLTFLTGGLVMGAAAALVACALMPAPSMALLLGAALMLLMALWQLGRWWRCPRCERALWHRSALAHGMRALGRPTGCPHSPTSRARAAVTLNISAKRASERLDEQDEPDHAKADSEREDRHPRRLVDGVIIVAVGIMIGVIMRVTINLSVILERVVL